MRASGSTKEDLWDKYLRTRRRGYKDQLVEHYMPLVRQVAKLNQQFTSPMDPATGAGKAYWPYSFATHIVTAGVHLKTGQVKLVEYVAAHDVGKVINPQSCRGQVIGGAARTSSMVKGWRYCERGLWTE